MISFHTVMLDEREQLITVYVSALVKSIRGYWKESCTCHTHLGGLVKRYVYPHTLILALSVSWHPDFPRYKDVALTNGSCLS